MSDLTQTESVAEVIPSETATKTWHFKNWKDYHKILASESSCLVEIGNAVLRFFLQHDKKEFQENGSTIVLSYYSLCVELVSGPTKLLCKLRTKLMPTYPTDFEKQKIGLYKKSCSFVLTKNPAQTFVAYNNFIYMSSYRIDPNSYENPCLITRFHLNTPDLKIVLQVTLCNLSENEAGNQNLEHIQAQVGNENSMACQLKSLLTDPELKTLFDVKLKMRDGFILEAQKAILAARSPVFRAMFTNQMKESTENIVEITDIGSEAMQIILNFIYTDVIDETWKSNVTEVVYAAGKYDLSKLLDYCDLNIITVCNQNNAIELFKLAKMYNLKTAMEQLTEFTRANTAEVLLGMDFE